MPATGADHGDGASARSAPPWTPETALIGFAGSPWTVAVLHGRGPRLQATSRAGPRAWRYRDPVLFDALLDVLVTQTTVDLPRPAQVEAGADVVMLFDSPGPACCHGGAVRAASSSSRPARIVQAAARARHPGPARSSASPAWPAPCSPSTPRGRGSQAVGAGRLGADPAHADRRRCRRRCRGAGQHGPAGARRRRVKAMAAAACRVVLDAWPRASRTSSTSAMASCRRRRHQHVADLVKPGASHA